MCLNKIENMVWWTLCVNSCAPLIHYSYRFVSLIEDSLPSVPIWPGQFQNLALCSGLPDFAASLSCNPARLHKINEGVARA